MSPIVFWLVAGVLLVVAETAGASGIGLIFAGLGALVTGSLIQFEIIAEENFLAQFSVFFAATAFFAALLWKIMRRTRNSNEGGYSNMIGETATVGASGLQKGKPGEVRWSGTIMRAEMGQDVAADSIPAGAQVTIIAVHGTTLTVKLKE